MAEAGTRILGCSLESKLGIGGKAETMGKEKSQETNKFTQSKKEASKEYKKIHRCIAVFPLPSKDPILNHKKMHEVAQSYKASRTAMLEDLQETSNSRVVNSNRAKKDRDGIVKSSLDTLMRSSQVR